VSGQARQVEIAYDELGPGFRNWAAQIEDEPTDRFLGRLFDLLPEGARVLDIGCGPGVKTKRLAERFEVLGVDLSGTQLELARAEVPEATFVQSDILELDLPQETFDAVTAFYSFMHIPRDRHPELLERILGWLKPGGLFLAPMSTIGGPDRVENWLGVDMFFSGWDAETNERLIREAGFEALFGDVIEIREPQGDIAFFWAFGRKP
jgi:cyclopropane fatty-acyl-phospholipid synthase-like methyltransferase